jgi:hypothetical protein
MNTTGKINKFTPLPQTPLQAVGTNSITCTGITGFYYGVNRPEYQADQRNVCCGVKNVWIYILILYMFPWRGEQRI